MPPETVDRLCVSSIRQLFSCVFVILSVSAPLVISAEDEWPHALKEAQIKALTTGDIADLSRFSDQAEPIRIASSWTALAAKKLKSGDVTISRESALMTGEFIFRGAMTFVAEGNPDKRWVAERNLQKFIDAEIELGKKESLFSPKIGESTFSAVRLSLCPLWPFC